MHNDLVLKCKSKDRSISEYSFNELIKDKEWKQLQSNIVKNYFLPNLGDIDDLKQLTLIYLLEAIRDYDINKGSSFKNWATFYIRGRVINEIKRQQQVKKLKSENIIHYHDTDKNSYD